MLTFDFITLAARGVSSGIAIFRPLYWLFGKCMEGLLIAFNGHYFIALIIFTILTRAVLFPINLRQQRTMAKTNRIQPKIQKIQKKYNVNSIQDPRQKQKANQQMQQEMQELYAREGHNPMNMGCGPMAFQMVFLMGIIGIIYYPIQYILNIGIVTRTADYTQKIAELINFKATTRGSYLQLEIIRNIANYKETLIANNDQLGGIFTDSAIAKIEAFKESLNIFGIDMTATPSLKGGGIIILIPILCLLTSLLSSVMSTLIQKKTNPAMSQQGPQMMLMMLMMPVFSAWFSLQVPAAVGFYWIISNIIATLQQLVTNKFFPPRKNIAREMIENTIERRAREKSIKNINE